MKGTLGGQPTPTLVDCRLLTAALPQTAEALPNLIGEKEASDWKMVLCCSLFGAGIHLSHWGWEWRPQWHIISTGGATAGEDVEGGKILGKYLLWRPFLHFVTFGQSGDTSFARPGFWNCG